MSWPKGKKRPDMKKESHPMWEKKRPKHSKWMKEYMNRPEIQLKNRLRMEGEGNPMFRKKHSPETIKKMRRVKMGKVVSEETKQKMRGKKHPHVSERNRINPPMLGRKRPNIAGENNPAKRLEIRKKISENNPNKRPENRAKISERMKNGGAAYALSFLKNPSKPQVQLFERVSILYPSTILNYPYKNYSIDIAIPEQKIAIEYDEPYWHKDGEADQKRQREIEQGGWKFLRYNKLPNDNILNADLKGI